MELASRATLTDADVTRWHPSGAWRLAAAALVCALLVGVPAGLDPQDATAASQPAAPSPGCGSSGATAETEVRHDLDIDGSNRWFIRTVPPQHDGVTPLPVVLDFHGLAEGAQIHTLMSELSPIAIREGFVAVLPHGQFDPVRWDLSADLAANEDIRFVDEILSLLGSELCIDRSRVYAMGLSYGAWMTWFLSCQRSEVFAAVATVAGLRDFTPCPRTRPVPSVSFYGTDDTILPFSEAAAAAKAEQNGCSGFMDHPVSAEVVHRVFDCPEGADVELFIVLGGGHAWPGSAFSQAIAAVVGHTTMDIHASEEAWAFFERHQLPCEITDTCPEPDPHAPDPASPPGAATDPPPGSGSIADAPDPAQPVASAERVGSVPPAAAAVATRAEPSHTG